MVKEAVAGAIDIVQIALRGLGGDLGDSGPHGEGDPSYKRYFEPGYLKVVGGVFQSILAALGAPNTQAIRDCISTVKMQFIYGDYIGSPTNSCAKGTVMAYCSFHDDKNGVTRSVICFASCFSIFFERTSLWHISRMSRHRRSPISKHISMILPVEKDFPRSIPELQLYFMNVFIGGILLAVCLVIKLSQMLRFKDLELKSSQERTDFLRNQV